MEPRPMDTLPPSPAAVTTAADDIHRAQARLRTTHRWLQEQDDQLPHAPEDPARPDATLQSVDRFWNAMVAAPTGDIPITRRQHFATCLARIATDDAALRLADRILSANAGRLLRAMPTDTDTPPPAHIHVEELVIGEASYAGMFMLRSELFPDTVLLFSSHRGWKEFASRKDLLAGVERDLRQELALHEELPGIARTAIEPKLDAPFLRGRPLTAFHYGAIADRIIQRHREKVEASLSGGEPDSFYNASTLHDLVDLRGMDMNRSAIRKTWSREDRPSDMALASYPAPLREAFEHAANDYDIATLRAVDAIIAGSVTPASTMAMFTRDELGKHLLRLGIGDAPEAIWVRSQRFSLGFRQAATALIQGRDESMVSLVNFARWNVGAGDLDTIAIVQADGTPHPRLSANTAVSMIRFIDIGRRYIEHLEERHGDSDAGRRYRQTARSRWLAKVRLDIARTRLLQHDASLGRGLLPDTRERGLQWMEATLAHPEPTSRKRVDGDDLLVQQLTYRGATVSDVFVIGTRSSVASSHVVVYTPDAPDRVAFREFRTRDDMIRAFLRDRTFESYLLDRLPSAFAAWDAEGHRHFDVPDSTKTLRWVFSSDDCDFCTPLVEPFSYRDVITDIADAAYESELEQSKRTAEHISRSTQQADEDAANGLYRIPHSLLGMPGEGGMFLAETMADSLAKATGSAWQLADHLRYGNYAEAVVDVASFYVNGLDVATIGPTPGAWSRGVMRRATKKTIATIGTDGWAAPAPSWIRLPETQWPAHAYYHASPRELDRLKRTGMLVLLQSRLGAGELRGVPITLFRHAGPPDPSLVATGWLPASAEGVPSSPGSWVRIDLHDALRGTNASATSFAVYRPIDGDGASLIIRPERSLPMTSDTTPLILFDHYAVEAPPAA